MLKLVENAGDLLLRMVIPKTTAAAAVCDWSVICRSCANCSYYYYRYRCCTGIGCSCLRYGTCGCRTGCPC